MKGLFLEQVRASPAVKCCGWADSFYLAGSNYVLFLENSHEVKLQGRIKWTASDGRMVYAITSESILLVHKEATDFQEIMKVDLEGVQVICAWYKSGRLLIHAENEVLVCDVERKRVARYTPYGHQILAMDIAQGEELVFVLLLSSCEQNVVRRMGMEGVLEELGQVAVSKNVYKIFSVESGGFIAVERGTLSIYGQENQRRSMSFGESIVRTGVSLSSRTFLMSGLSDELCVLDTQEFRITKYIGTACIVTEGIVRAPDAFYIYNRKGEVGICEDGEVRVLRRAGPITHIKAVPEFGTVPLYALQSEATRHMVGKIRRQLRKTPTRKTVVREKPVQILASKEYTFIKYLEGSEIRQEGEAGEPVGVEVEVVSFAFEEGAAVFVTRSGLVCRYSGRVLQENCLFCGHEKKTENVKKVAPGHMHEDAILQADMQGDGLLYTAAAGTYFWSCAKRKRISLGEHAAYSLSMHRGVAVIGNAEDSVAIDVETQAQEKLPFFGRAVVRVEDSTYLVHKHDGSLWCMSAGGDAVNICAGSVILRNIRHTERGLLVNTMNSTLLVYRHRTGEMCAEYVEPVGGSGVACVHGRDVLVMHVHDRETGEETLQEYRLDTACEYALTEEVPHKDVLDFVALENKYMLVLSSKSRSISVKEAVELGRPNGIVASLYSISSAALLGSITYEGANSVHTVRLHGRVALGINTEDGAVLVLLEVGGAALQEIDRAVLNKTGILSLYRNKGVLYCNTTKGLQTYRVGRKGLEMPGKCAGVPESRCAIKKPYLVEYSLARIRLYAPDTELKQPQATYIDRAKSEQKVFAAFNKDYFLVGHAQEEEGSVSLLKKVGGHMEKVLTLELPSAVVALERASFSLVKRADSLAVLTREGSVYRISLVPDALVGACTLPAEGEGESPVVIASESEFPFLAASSCGMEKAVLVQSPEAVGLMRSLI
ncbi:uncharacterized protein NEMAJ01_1487 [Nematocida major]|uniref:uncharacterized protein n=1 Tax=Nematocida major TaxID=1912982 RepID=UPI0020079349|nr:uncharacterized protein NEMAJ01_1487 [Nematocida major]KAH9386591.1 hypothetical protein NEMAJ01_1487 [Nematocida major]